MRLRKPGYCWPWRHKWGPAHRVSVPLWDPSAKGLLWYCTRCPETKAK